VIKTNIVLYKIFNITFVGSRGIKKQITDKSVYLYTGKLGDTRRERTLQVVIAGSLSRRFRTKVTRFGPESQAVSTMTIIMVVEAMMEGKATDVKQIFAFYSLIKYFSFYIYIFSLRTCVKRKVSHLEFV